MEDAYFVYILTNNNHTVLYTGVTNDIYTRVLEHHDGINPGFTSKYKVHKLVYVDPYGDINEAIDREKAIKGGSRQRKLDLINSVNPNWDDLWEKEFGEEEPKS